MVKLNKKTTIKASLLLLFFLVIALIFLGTTTDKTTEDYSNVENVSENTNTSLNVPLNQTILNDTIAKEILNNITKENDTKIIQ